MNFWPRTNTSNDRCWNRVRLAVWLIAWGSILPCNALAYIDPGTSGLLSQVLYVMFYGVLGMFFYMLRHLKSFLIRAREFFSRALNFYS